MISQTVEINIAEMKHECYKYEIKLVSAKINSIVDIFSGAELYDFAVPVSQKGSKIYILKKSNEFLYVGATIQRMLLKLKQGLAAKGLKGYHGYKWKDYDSIDLAVYCFADLQGTQLESIEAELVYKIRQETGKWPLCQNEILFYNDFLKAHQIACEIYQEISD